MDKDIKAVIILLATQAMINMGEIKNPFTNEANIDLPGASTFIGLLEVLENKTRGNLTPEEDTFLQEVKQNLERVYNKKSAGQ